MKRRLVLITEIIAPYRIPVLNALARHDDIELIVIFLSETDPALRGWLVYKDEIRFNYQVLPALRWRLGKFNVLLNRRLGQALDEAKPDVILCGGYNYLAAWRAQVWARRRDVPFLLWLESTAADQRNNFPWVEFLKRHFIRNCRAFVVPGKASRKYLGQLGVPDQSIFQAPNAVDNDFFSRSAESARAQAATLRRSLRLPDRYLLFVGRLVPAKGVFDLLDAYAKLDSSLRRTLAMVIAGDGPAAERLRRHASQISDGQIHFARFVQRDGLPPYYALADALVFPTHSDTWGFVVNEAMACSLPVIASAVAGCVPDLVQDGWNGKIVPPRNPDLLAQAISEMAQSTDLLQQMGERGAEMIRRYSPEACANGIAEAVRICV